MVKANRNLIDIRNGQEERDNARLDPVNSGSYETRMGACAGVTAAQVASSLYSCTVNLELLRLGPQGIPSFGRVSNEWQKTHPFERSLTFHEWWNLGILQKLSICVDSLSPRPVCFYRRNTAR
jgi:hypothetical protein